MTGYSPPSIPPSWFGGTALLFFVALAFALLVVQEPLLILFPAVVVGGFYLSWRFLLAVEAIADALQRIASNRRED